jgi:hypothetical protein
MGTKAMAEDVVMDAAQLKIWPENMKNHPDIMTAAGVLVDKHRMRAYLGWAEKIGARGWKVN